MSPTQNVDPVQAVRLAVVVPLANEEDTVDEFMRRLQLQLAISDRVYCILDNASRDSTRERVENFASTDRRFACIWAPEDRSVVEAYFRGYREALASGALWILEMDGGLSHSPEEIPRFVAAMEAGSDFAGGSRFIKGASWSGPPGRFVVSRGGTVLANTLLGTSMRDMTSGFECFSRPALQLVLDHGVQSRAHFFQTEIRYLMHRLKWVEVPITYQSPSNRLGTSTLQDALRSLRSLRQEHVRSRREAR